MRSRMTRFGYGVSCVALALAGCATDEALLEGDDDSESPADLATSEITGSNAVGRNATIQSYVLVRVGASDAEIQRAAVQQIRPLFGALKAMDVGLGNRLDTPAAPTFIDARTFQRDTVDVVDPAHPETRVSQLMRVRFTYTDRAIVTLRLGSSRALNTTTLFGDYNAHADDIVQQCQTEKMDWGASGIWYNYEPQTGSCQSLISAETARLAAERRLLRNGDREVTVNESTRWFTPISVKLTTISRSETKYPDYHRVWDDGQLVIGSFFGEDKHDDPNDYGARNFFTYIRTVLQARPELRVAAAGTDLTRVTFNGATITNVTALQVAQWIVDKTNYPTQVPLAMRDAFRQTVIRQWRDKAVTLSASVNVSINGTARAGGAQVRVYYGDEEGAGTGAVQRYQAAFRDVDVFQYTGHSHLGSGPLDARNYSASNFPNRYQVLMINSCVSFNYYNTFFAMHPGGTLNLDTVTNGLPVFLEGSGLSSARFAVAFLDGRFRSYADILGGMRVDLPWERGHDANRVADGETDNTFTPTRQRMTLAFTR
ncbi:MAG: hypothetical protein JWM10_2214 [Myxococcaceae bacterium]|nr:hypothetical protein [Myxococcaceae bacterium]